MHAEAEELRILRERIEELQDAVDRLPQGGPLESGPESLRIPCTVTTTVPVGSGYASPSTTGRVSRDDTGVTGLKIKNPGGSSYAVGKFLWAEDRGDPDGYLWLIVGSC